MKFVPSTVITPTILLLLTAACNGAQFSGSSVRGSGEGAPPELSCEETGTCEAEVPVPIDDCLTDSKACDVTPEPIDETVCDPAVSDCTKDPGTTGGTDDTQNPENQVCETLYDVDGNPYLPEGCEVTEDPTTDPDKDDPTQADSPTQSAAPYQAQP